MSRWCARLIASTRLTSELGGMYDLRTERVPAREERIGQSQDATLGRKREGRARTLRALLAPVRLEADDVPPVPTPLAPAPLLPLLADGGRDEVALGEDEDDLLLGRLLVREDVLLERRRKVQRRAADVDQDEQDRRQLERAPQLAVDLEVALEVGRRPRPLDRRGRGRGGRLVSRGGCRRRLRVAVRAARLVVARLDDRPPLLDGGVGAGEPLLEQAGLVGLDLVLGLAVPPLWPARDRQLLLERLGRLDQLEREEGRVVGDRPGQRVRQGRRLGLGDVLRTRRRERAAASADCGWRKQGSGQQQLERGEARLAHSPRASTAGTWTRACDSRRRRPRPRALTGPDLGAGHGW